MSGFSDYAAKSNLNWITGQIAAPSLPAVFLALFTAAPADSGSGGTEVSGGSYARIQIAGSAATNAATATSSNTLHFASTPAWISAGMSVYDVTTGEAVGTVSSTTGTTVVLDANALNSVSSGDVLSFSAFSNATGSAPSSVTNGAIITFATPTANWGTLVAFGLYDAATSGDLLFWDYLGNFPWLPCYITSASPGMFDAKANGYSAGDTLVYSTEYGGTLPSFSQSNLTGLLAAVSPSGDAFSVTNEGTAVNTSSTGSGMVRKVGSQVVSAGVVASFAAGALSLTSA